jgi:hypothetical protein
MEQGVKLPLDFKPIYQFTDDHDPKEVKTARKRSTNTTARSHVSSLSTQTSTPSKRSANNATGSTGKCYDAPSPEHDFPDANITLAEIAAFLPQSIKSWDVADRILWNDAATEDLATLINKYRTMSAGTIDKTPST